MLKATTEGFYLMSWSFNWRLCYFLSKAPSVTVNPVSGRRVLPPAAYPPLAALTGPLHVWSLPIELKRVNYGWSQAANKTGLSARGWKSNRPGRTLSSTHCGGHIWKWLKLFQVIWECYKSLLCFLKLGTEGRHWSLWVVSGCCSGAGFALSTSVLIPANRK